MMDEFAVFEAVTGGVDDSTGIATRSATAAVISWSLSGRAVHEATEMFFTPMDATVLVAICQATRDAAADAKEDR